MPPLWHNGIAMTEPLTESDIRKALLADLARRVTDGSVVIEEMPIDGRRARIDVASVGEKLRGYEIKSDFDTFDRFSNQIHAYNRVFDELAVVTGRRYADAAFRVLPNWWGIGIAVTTSRGNVIIEWRRAPGINMLQSAHSVASLLWRDEAIEALRVAGRPTHGARATRQDVFDELCEALDLPALKACVLNLLLARTAQNNV